MTTKLKLTSAFTDTTLPKFKVDPMLPDAGALMLIDPIHTANPWAAGVPTDTTVLPNLAEAQALAVLATSDVTKVRPTMRRGAAFTGAAGLVERTGKGGLHAISPQSGAAVAGSGPAIAFPTALITYILAHPTHDYYMSGWGRLTRSPAASYGNSAWFGINGNGQQTSSYLINASPGSTPAGLFNTRPFQGSAKYIGQRTPADSSLGNKLITLGAHGWQTVVGGSVMADPQSLPGDGGPNSAVTGSFAGGTVSFGSSTAVPGIGATGTTTTGANIDFTSGAAQKDKADSHIIYRVYLEDLTLSGRTYAAVDALDFAQYTKDVLTAGGRYNGDTFTDPATLP